MYPISCLNTFTNTLILRNDTGWKHTITWNCSAGNFLSFFFYSFFFILFFRWWSRIFNGFFLLGASLLSSLIFYILNSNCGVVFVLLFLSRKINSLYVFVLSWFRLYKRPAINKELFGWLICLGRGLVFLGNFVMQFLFQNFVFLMDFSMPEMGQRFMFFFLFVVVVVKVWEGVRWGSFAVFFLKLFMVIGNKFRLNLTQVVYIMNQILMLEMFKRLGSVEAGIKRSVIIYFPFFKKKILFLPSGLAQWGWPYF